ncbi:unnamed protein product [Larinioides sclopetarius]|uniref:Uncharacterized protein n=1 Tax=Larinioides sclopetarius TaxID=280406 RepID=A0AAV1Z164_9ARAC
MKLTIEQFSAIFCIGYPSISSTEEGNLCSDIREYRDFEYDDIFDSIEMLRLGYSKEFIDAVAKIFVTDIKDGFASKRKFMCFLLSKCMKLSETPTFFSFLLVCILVQEVLSGMFYFIDVECFTVAKMASKCLIAAFHRKYVDLFDKENGFEGFVNYCAKLNETLFPTSDEDSETESERTSENLEGFTPPDTDGLSDLLHSLKEVDEVNFLLTDFEKKLLYERDSLPLDIDPSEDIFLQLDDISETNEIKSLDVAIQNLNIKSNHTLERLDELCPLCKDNCYKHVVLAAKELEVGEI